MHDFYGPSTSLLQGGLPTDRLVAEWWLRSARVRRTLGEEDSAAGPESLRRLWCKWQCRARLQTGNETRTQRKLAESLQTRNRLRA